jgi:hypothetical protein
LGHFGDRITIQPQRGQGMSNIMFSSCLTIGDAIAAAGKLKSMLRLTEIASETIDSVIPRIFLILSIRTVYGSDTALYAFSSISQQINLRSD